jgi:hypothetical protein
MASRLFDAESTDELGIHRLAKTIARWVLGLRDTRGFSFSPTPIYEWPKLHNRDRSSQKDLNDLLHLPAIGAAVAIAVDAEPIRVHPEQWKHQIPKPENASKPYIVEQRVRARLSVSELDRLPVIRSAKRHNMYDAIGIGLHFTGRSILDPIKIFPR